MSKRILIAEDDGLVALGIERTLADSGYIVGPIARSASEAILQAASQQPDLVLMDIRLSGDQDGIGAARAITERHAVPVVFLTAHADPATLARAMGPQAFGFLPKPFTSEQLKAAVEMALYRHAADRQLRSSLHLHVATLDSLGLAVVAVDRAGRVTLLNRVAEQLTGWQSADALGQPGANVVRLLSEPGLESLPSPLEAALRAEGMPYTAPYAVLRDSAGTQRPVDYSATPVRSETGLLEGAAIVFRDLTERHRAEKERERLTQELSTERARLQALSAQLLTAQEEERRRLALAIHDELGQMLTALLMHIRNIGVLGGPPVALLVEDCQQMVKTLMSDVRQLAWRIHPQVLTDLGLGPALEWLAREHIRSLGLTAEVKVVLPPARLPRPLETACFRIAQEAVSNAVQHANPRRICLTAHLNDGELLLAVTDDGNGFDTAAALERARQRQSMGLLGMEERARLVGGRLDLQSAPGQGTTVRAVLPAGSC